tara:strand:+ start:580 stop:783 length:204 start_codon:yes stop_codon:yes gene_type:complete
MRFVAAAVLGFALMAGSANAHHCEANRTPVRSAVSGVVDAQPVRSVLTRVRAMRPLQRLLNRVRRCV